MKFYSTNDTSIGTSFKQAVIESLPKDNGLYFPEEIPVSLSGLLSEITSLSLPEIGFQLLKPYCGQDIPDDKLREILEETFCFDIPLVKVQEGVHSLELTHGPTFAFKDVGARFLARCLSFFQEGEDEEVTILVATSGDTGGAVADGFFDIPGINVVVLYPSGKVSPLQELQIAGLGKNITALEVDGNFDDCQKMVKSAFLDDELRNRKKLSSANSINIARWLPQAIYYAVPFQNFGQDYQPVISVPSGNYGNVTAGILAKKSGLPIKRFIAGSNANDVVPRYLRTQEFDPKPTIPTISNAMDVSLPSNYVRLHALYGKNFQEITAEIEGYAMSDAGTRSVIIDCLAQSNYLLDPHSAIGFQSLVDGLKENESGVFLSTAHPCKFKEVIDEALGKEMEMPDFTDSVLTRKKRSIQIKNDYDEFKSFLMST